MAKKKVTKAMRSAAAKASWARRRAAAEASVAASISATPTGKAITTERRTTHGDFATNAFISQKIKAVMYGSDSMTDVQREAIDMIALKLARIGSGQSSYADHWVDIIGYAQLALDQIESGEAVG